MKRTYDGRKERVFKEGKRGKGAEGRKAVPMGQRCGDRGKQRVQDVALGSGK